MILEILHEIVNYMREHPDEDIISTDDPRNREIGWTSTSDEFPRSWRITLTQLQRDISEDEVVRRAAISLTTSQGRREAMDVLRSIATEPAENPPKKDGLASFVGNPPVPPPPPPPRNRFQIIDDD